MFGETARRAILPLMYRGVETLERRLLFAASGERMLFIRGGSGTGGFLDGGSLAQRDDELADINNNSTASGNHGWGALASMLRADGFTLEQMIEGPASNNTPVNLSALDLSRYSLIVFGSNNAAYSTASLDAVESFVRAGGGALFMSDANFGSNYGDAPSSDQQFLDRFGLIMNQDKDVYTVTRAGGDFLQPNHPLLVGVNSFDGEGISLGVRSSPVASATAQVIVRGRNQTRDNNGSAKGPDRDVTFNDGALVVAAVGLGRVAITFDRNTFFNANGAGSQLTKLDNTRYAKNLFEWTAAIDGGTPQVLAADFAYETAPQRIRFAFNANVQASLSASDLNLKNLTTGATITPAEVSWDGSNRAAVFRFSSLLPVGSYLATLKASGVNDGSHSLASDYPYRFFVLAGDANRDARVDSIDLNALSRNFGRSGRNYSSGNFDYSADGKISSIDFNVLARSFGDTVVMSSAPMAQSGDHQELRLKQTMSHRLVEDLLI
jgi:hypothetical protein